jgi:hypothetical protein
MSSALLIVPHFWDPVCVPLGVSSLKAYAEQRGHTVALLDLNTDPDIFGAQRAYFAEGKAQFPYWANWNIERNGTDMLAIHQILYLFARNRPDYGELVAEVLNMDGRSDASFGDRLQVSRFDAIFASLYARVAAVLTATLRRFRPDVIGCSLFNSTWPGTLYLLRRAKQILPRVRTVVGGPGPIMGITSRGDEVRAFMARHDFIDYFVIGEGEQPFVEILEREDLPRGVLDPQRGVIHVRNSTAFVPAAELPAPDYGELAVPRYLQLSVASSRGCPYACSFCAETVFWKGFRIVGRSRTFQQMRQLAERYRRRSFYLCDSLSNPIIGPLTADITESGKPYTIDCYLRADATAVDTRATRKWREGGLARARLGMESASQRILDAMVKKTTPDYMARSLRALADDGVLTSTLWIVAYPGETEQEFEETLRFIRTHRPSIYQADAWLFQYHPDGLANSRMLHELNGSRRRFPADINDILAVSPYVVDRDLSPGERFDRLERFVRTMKELEIPNPYSVYEWLVAENRWTSLGHTSAWNIESSVMALNA